MLCQPQMRVRVSARKSLPKETLQGLQYGNVDDAYLCLGKEVQSVQRAGGHGKKVCGIMRPLRIRQGNAGKPDHQWWRRWRRRWQRPFAYFQPAREIGPQVSR